MLKRIFVGDNERVLLSKSGRFKAILTPGVCRVFGLPWPTSFFLVVETGDDEVSLVYAGGKLVRVVGPARRALFWKRPITVTFEHANVKTAPEVPRAKPPVAAPRRTSTDRHDDRALGTQGRVQVSPGRRRPARRRLRAACPRSLCSRKRALTAIGRSLHYYEIVIVSTIPSARLS